MFFLNIVGSYRFESSVAPALCRSVLRLSLFGLVLAGLGWGQPRTATPFQEVNEVFRDLVNDRTGSLGAGHQLLSYALFEIVGQHGTTWLHALEWATRAALYGKPR